MDLNSILIWTVCISCVTLLIRAKQLSSSSQQGWIIVSGGILLLMGLIWQLYPYSTGYAGGLLWLGFIFFPLLGYRHVQQLMSQERYLQAANHAAFWRWFHPTDGWWEQPKVLKALALAQQGNLESATEILNRYQTRGNSLSWLAMALVYRMNSEWEELLTWMQKDLPASVMLGSPDLAMFYLRGLGETGDLNKLLQEFRRLKPILETGGNLKLNMISMTILAFCGQSEFVDFTFRHHLRKYPTSIREFWIATAEIAAGNEAGGRDRLRYVERDLHQQDLAWQNAIKRRLAFNFPEAEKVLTPKSLQTIGEIKTQLSQEIKYGGALNFSSHKAWATYGLIAINCLFFVWETVAGGNENEETLYRLGALIPEVVWQGEWWRLLSATFLHYGILHLSMNMLGLYFLGAYVESYLGIGKYLMAYFFSGIGSMLVVTVAAILTKAPPQIVVGASGAIMGMVGALVAILLKGWVRDKAPLAGQRLRSVLFIIGLQIVFDLNTPQVSFLGHLSGLILGFAIACLFVFFSPKSLKE
jgi:rhomboid protease GluP